MTITGAQVRKARTLLGWSIMRLAGEVGVSETTVGIFERGNRSASWLDLAKVRSVLELEGAQFMKATRRTWN